MKEIIHKHKDGKWYFFNEFWAICNGPYNSKEEAENALEEYWEKER